jgi:hypothetical protein
MSDHWEGEIVDHIVSVYCRDLKIKQSTAADSPRKAKRGHSPQYGIELPGYPLSLQATAILSRHHTEWDLVSLCE